MMGIHKERGSIFSYVNSISVLYHVRSNPVQMIKGSGIHICQNAVNKFPNGRFEVKIYCCFQISLDSHITHIFLALRIPIIKSQYLDNH